MTDILLRALKVRVSQRILVSAPRDSVRLYLKDIRNLPRYKRKARSMEVLGGDDQGVKVALAGRFLGIPWKGDFRVDFTSDGGYTAEMTKGPLKAMTCCLQLQPVAGGTMVTHEEQYHFPLLVRPWMVFFKGTLRHILQKELHSLKEGAEMLNRRLQLEAIDSTSYR